MDDLTMPAFIDGTVTSGDSVQTAPWENANLVPFVVNAILFALTLLKKNA